MVNMQQQYFNKLSEATRLILQCGNNFFEMKRAADQMYEVYTAISEVNAGNSKDGEIMLASGKAISPGAAAHCLLEFRRTAVFLRGICKAIQSITDKAQDRPVSILYAGCGPYATLVTPLFTLFTPDQLQVDFLDINDTSLSSAEKIVTSLGVEQYVRSYHLEDAATCDLPQGCDCDIVISETMQSCLANEPQIAIMQNLIPQMREDAIFIPEEISIDAYLTDPKQEMDKFFYSEKPKPPVERISLGNVLRFNKECLKGDEFNGEVTIPEDISTCVDLKLFTTVKVFAEELLNDNDSSITMPKKYYEFKKRYAHRVLFWYDQTIVPKIECKVVEFT